MNKVTFEGRLCVLAGRKWSSEDPDAAEHLVPALDEYTAMLDGPGPQDGFVTEGAFLAPKVAEFHGGTVVELDRPNIPPEPGDGRVY